MNSTQQADKCYLLKVWISIINQGASVCLYSQATSPISPGWSNVQVILQTKQDTQDKGTKKNLNQRVWVSLSNFLSFMEKNPTLPLLYPPKTGEGRKRHGSRKTRTINRMFRVKLNECLHYIVLTHLGKCWAKQCLYDIICWVFSLWNSSSKRYCVSSIGMNEWMHFHLGKKKTEYHSSWLRLAIEYITAYERAIVKKFS